jgi:formate dehydrogenase subunit beta
MDSLRNKARQLLESKEVDCIIGYIEGSGSNVRAGFITDPEQTKKLVYDHRCKQNLGVYLTKQEVLKMGKLAIIAPVPVMRTILILTYECQIAEDSVKVLGIGLNGQFLSFNHYADIEKYLVENCNDHPEEDRKMIKKLNDMTVEERWDFWMETLKPCVKCFACRQACPMCYCVRCQTECNQPQWIPVQASELGNMEWHFMRAMHLAGRCTGCGDCGLSCPLGIPVHLLTFKMSDVVLENFDTKAGLSMKEPSTLSTYKANDKESFIR